MPTIGKIGNAMESLFLKDILNDRVNNALLFNRKIEITELPAIFGGKGSGDQHHIARFIDPLKQSVISIEFFPNHIDISTGLEHPCYHHLGDGNGHFFMIF